MDAPKINVMDRMPEKISFDLREVDSCCLRDKFGQPVRFGDIRKGFLCIVVFARKHEVKIIVVACAPSRFIESFCEEINFPHEMYADSRRLIHQVLQLHTHPQYSSIGKSNPHAKSNFISSMLQTLWRAMKTMTEQGDPLQQGGQLIIGRDDKIVYFHRDVHALDHTPINKLLDEAGMPQLDFRCPVHHV